MIINVHVKIRSKQSSCKQCFDIVWNEFYLAHIQSPPKDGKANDELIWLLAKHFNIIKKNIQIISWVHSTHKSVSISL